MKPLVELRCKGACACPEEAHATRRVVVTGGPGAGKTALLESVRRELCGHVSVLPEAAGVLFTGGFPRAPTPPGRRAVQRAIYHVQSELERLAVEENRAALLLCDRGTPDGEAYWPGPGDFYAELATTRAAELARYDAVIHLRTPPAGLGYDCSNPLRIESAQEAAAIDRRIAHVWQDHPRVFTVPHTANFMDKVLRALALIADELPACCRGRQTAGAHGRG